MVCQAPINHMKARQAGQATSWCSCSVLVQFSSWRTTSSVRRNKCAMRVTMCSSVKELIGLKSTCHQSEDPTEFWAAGTPLIAQIWVNQAFHRKATSRRTSSRGASPASTSTISSTGVLTAFVLTTSLGRASITTTAACGTTTSERAECN